MTSLPHPFLSGCGQETNNVLCVALLELWYGVLEALLQLLLTGDNLFGRVTQTSLVRVFTS